MLRSLTLTSLLAAALVATATAHDDDPKLRDRRAAYRGPGVRNALVANPAANGAQLPLGGGLFQSSGIQLLAWMPLSEFGSPSNANDIWGYTSPAGREYAIFCHSSGTAFVDISAPGNPVIVANISGPTSLWRDARTYSHYAYTVSEGGGGIQVYDLAQIDVGIVTELASVNDDPTDKTHNVALDEDSGFLYRCGGGSNGLRVYDLANPAAPARVGEWSTRYAHDAQIVTYTSGPYAGKQLAFVFDGNSSAGGTSTLTVLDITNKSNPIELNAVSYANAAYSHQGWLSPDKQWLYLGDEFDENGSLPTTTYVFDVSDPANPIETTSFTNGSNAVGHNLFTKGDRIFAANYTSGLRIFDATNPQAPVEIAWFDTWTQNDNATYNSLWGVYPYFDSGLVVGSDLEKGLFVWWIGDPPITIELATPFSAVSSEVQVLVSEATPGELVVGSVMLHVDAGSGFVTTPLTDLGGGVFSGSLASGVPCGSSVEWYVSAQSSNGLSWTYPENAPLDLARSNVAAWQAPWSADDTESAGSWAVGAAGDTATTGLWEHGDPNGTAAQPEDDHTTSGANCWFTGQGAVGGSSATNDVDGGATTLTSPPFDLSSASAPQLSYWRWFSNSSGASPGEDVLEVEVSADGTNWVLVETVGPTGFAVNGGWFEHRFRVEDFVALGPAVQVRFRVADSGNGSIVEAAIDDLAIVVHGCDERVVPYCPGDGTLASCPCSNESVPGAVEGCLNSTGAGARLTHLGTASTAADDLVLVVTQARPGRPGLFVQGANDTAITFKDGLFCLGNPTERLEIITLDAFGSARSTQSILTEGNVFPGQTRRYQLWFRDDGLSVCGTGSNFTGGLRVAWE